MEHSALQWARDGADWPHHERSRFVDAAGLRWHVQIWPAGDGVPTPAPTVLLLHGTGAATHSWRSLAPLLTDHAEVIAIDLPGHGFTSVPTPAQRSTLFSLPGMAAGVTALLQVLQRQPALIVGHSAGAAVALQMVLDTPLRPRAVVGLNAALLPMGGPLWPLLSSSAKWIAGSDWVARSLARRAQQPTTVQRLLDSTGSCLDERGVALYARLVRSPSHVASTLAMMANWNLQPLLARLPTLQTPVQLVVAESDRTVPPWQARNVWKQLPAAVREPLVSLPGLGHLAHEEAPEKVAEVVRDFLRDISQEISHGISQEIAQT
jgi:magnesium chelatase accessory protein